MNREDILILTRFAAGILGVLWSVLGLVHYLSDPTTPNTWYIVQNFVVLGMAICIVVINVLTPKKYD
jgi:peptidoglycan/LPS O-acetylase OafA/YrhL